MIEKTTLKNEIIKDLIFKNYNIKISDIKKLNRGSANIYTLNNNKYILKEFQKKYQKEDIEKEITILNHLKKDNIPVPEYIKTNNNSYYIIYDEKIIILEKFIKGYTPDSNTGKGKEIKESAMYLGKIISSLKNLDIELKENNIKDNCNKEEIEKSIEKINKLIGKININKDNKIFNDLNDKKKMLEYLKDNLHNKNIDKITIMKTHGDYSLLQFIYDNNEIVCILDFISSCKMPIIWEIIRSYSYIDSKAKDGIIDINNLIEYVKIVNNYVKLNKYDLEYMVYIYLIQLLESTYGYKQYILDNNDSLLNFAYFRTNLSKYLFKYQEKIKDELIKNINL